MMIYEKHTIEGITFHYECEYYDAIPVLKIDELDKEIYDKSFIKNLKCKNEWSIIYQAENLIKKEFTTEIKNLKPEIKKLPDIMGKPKIINSFETYDETYEIIIYYLKGDCHLIYSVDKLRNLHKKYYDIININKEEDKCLKKEQFIIRDELINKPHELFRDMDDGKTLHIILNKHFKDIIITKIPDIEPAKYSIIYSDYL